MHTFEWNHLAHDRDQLPAPANMLMDLQVHTSKGKGKVVPVLNQLSTMPWRHMGSGDIAPVFLTSTLDRQVFSFTAWPLYPLGKNPHIPIRQETGWTQAPVSMLWNRETFLAPAGNQTPTGQPVACQYAKWAILTPLRFHKMPRISLVADKLLVSQTGLCTLELVGWSVS
jgi:hypothetical protein